MLNDFLEKWAPAPKQQLVRSVNELVTLMRHFEHPVIWIRQEFEPDLRDAFLEMKRKGIRITVKGTQGCLLPKANAHPGKVEGEALKRNAFGFCRSDFVYALACGSKERRISRADPNSQFSVKVREIASATMKLTALHVNSYFGTMPSVVVIPAFSSRSQFLGSAVVRLSTRSSENSF